MKRIYLFVSLPVFLAGFSLVAGWIEQSQAQPAGEAQEGDSGPPNPPAMIGHPSFLSPHASPIAVHGGRVFVVNTPSDTVDVISAKTGKIGARIDVGIDPEIDPGIDLRIRDLD